MMEKYGKATPEAPSNRRCGRRRCSRSTASGDIKISVKHNDPVIMVEAYRQLAAQCDYPLHLGVTEAGPAFQGTIKSAVAFGARCYRRGSATRSACPCRRRRSREIKVGDAILQSLNLRPRRLEIVSCPSCGRAQVDVYKLAEK